MSNYPVHLNRRGSGCSREQHPSSKEAPEGPASVNAPYTALSSDSAAPLKLNAFIGIVRRWQKTPRNRS